MTSIAVNAAYAAFLQGLRKQGLGPHTEPYRWAEHHSAMKPALANALEAVRKLLRDETADEVTAICAQTVLEATEITNARIAELEQAAARLNEIEDGPDDHAGALLAALRALYDTWQDKVVPVESAEHGYHGISYEDVAAMDDAAGAVRRLLAGEDRG